MSILSLPSLPYQQLCAHTLVLFISGGQCALAIKRPEKTNTLPIVDGTSKPLPRLDQLVVAPELCLTFSLVRACHPLVL